MIDPPGASQIVKPVPLVAGNSDVGIEFTEAEIEQLTGETSTMTISGAVSGNNLTIRPDMVMRVTPRLRVTIEIGGESDEGEN